jgi:putative two-component system response regulator
MTEDGQPVVLIVDDTDTNIDILVEMLGEVADVRVALDGETALEIVAEERPDIALLDVYMPDMDGFQLAEAINASVAPGVPIVFITGDSDADVQERANALGAKSVLTKPVDRERILEIVEKHTQ